MKHNQKRKASQRVVQAWPSGQLGLWRFETITQDGRRTRHVVTGRVRSQFAETRDYIRGFAKSIDASLILWATPK